MTFRPARTPAVGVILACLALSGTSLAALPDDVDEPTSQTYTCTTEVTAWATPVDDETYAWHAKGTFRCLAQARGTLTVELESGDAHAAACTPDERIDPICEVELGGIARRGDCFTATARPQPESRFGEGSGAIAGSCVG